MSNAPAAAQLELLAVTRSGLEAVVARELADLDYDAKGTHPGRVLFHAGESAIARTNINLRVADRVLIRLAHFEARDFGVLFDRAADTPWERFIPRGAAITVRGRCVRSQLSSAPACQSIVKKAMIERLRRAWHTDIIDEREPMIVAEVELFEDHASLTLDTTGPSLHKRGYRDLVSEAPLKENLAAAMVQLSVWRPDRPLIDPFCGSGTIPIEAAMIARRIAPGVTRAYSAEAWGTIDAALWEAARDEARANELHDAPALHIAGYDIDEEPLSLARRHAERAGVTRDIHFQRRAFAELRGGRDHGVIIANPPWGERLEDHLAVQALYESMPDVFNRLPTWSVYVLTPRNDFEELLGRVAERRRKVHNGTIECTLYQFLGPRPESDDVPVPFRGHTARVYSPAAKRELSPGAAAAARTVKQQELLRNRLDSRVKHLRKWATREGISCYRLYDRDIPEVPLLIERYGDRVLIVDIYGPRSGRSPEEHAAWIDRMCEAIALVADVPMEQLFVRRTDGRRVGSRESAHGKAPPQFTADERGTTYRVDFTDPANAGMRLELRGWREALRAAAAGKAVLDLSEEPLLDKRELLASGASRAVIGERESSPRDDRFDIILGGAGEDGAPDSDDATDRARRIDELCGRLTPNGFVWWLVAHEAPPVTAREGFTARDDSRRLEQPDLRSERLPKLWRVQRTRDRAERSAGA